MTRSTTHLNPMYSLPTELSTQKLKIEIDQNSLSLWKNAQDDQRFVIVGWWKVDPNTQENVLEIRFKLGLPSYYKEDQYADALAEFKSKYGENNVVVAVQGSPGQVHIETIKKVENLESKFTSPEYKVIGLSATKKITNLTIKRDEEFSTVRQSLFKPLPRSSQNRYVWNMDPLARAFFALGEQDLENAQWYDLERSIPSVDFYQISQAIVNKISTEVDPNIILEIDEKACPHSKIEEEWKLFCQEYIKNPARQSQIIQAKLEEMITSFIHELHLGVVTDPAETLVKIVEGFESAFKIYNIEIEPSTMDKIRNTCIRQLFLAIEGLAEDKETPSEESKLALALEKVSYLQIFMKWALIDSSCPVDLSSKKLIILFYHAKNNLMQLKDFIRENKIKVNEVKLNNNSLLEYALIEKNIELAHYLLDEQKIEVNQRTLQLFFYNKITDINLLKKFLSKFPLAKEEFSPLQIAVEQNANVEIIQFLLEPNRAENERKELRLPKDEFHDRSLAYLIAIKKGFSQALSYLVHSGVDVNIRDGLGRSALHYAVLQKNDDIASSLLENKTINFNTQDNEGQTSLHLYVKSVDLISDQFEIPLLVKTNVNLKNNSGFTPLDFLLQNMATMPERKLVRLVDRLLRRGAEFHPHLCTDPLRLFELAITYEWKKVINGFLSPEFDIFQFRDNDGNSIMHIAVRSQDIEIVKKLLEKNPDLNLVNNNRETPLQLAATDEMKSLLRFRTIKMDDVEELRKKLADTDIVLNNTGSPGIQFMKIVDALVQKLNEQLQKMNLAKQVKETGGFGLFALTTTATETETCAKLYQVIKDIENNFARIPFLPDVPREVSEFKETSKLTVVQLSRRTTED